MSQKHRNRRQKRKIPWLIIILGGVLLLTAGWIWFADRGGGDGGGTPDIAVDPPSIDFGDQTFGTNLTFEIEVTNRGDGVLRFEEDPYIKVLEGC